MAHTRLLRKHRLVLVGGAFVAAYVLVLVLWAGAPPQHVSVALPRASTPRSAAPGSTSAAPDGLDNLLGSALPTSSITADPLGLPKHAVRIEVTSDRAIAALGYKVLNGNPPEYSATRLPSPFVVTRTGRSSGPVAYVVAQSATDASRITCTLTIDGTVRSTHTVRGAGRFTACVG